MVDLDNLLTRCYVAQQLEIEGSSALTFQELEPILEELRDLRIKCSKLESQRSASYESVVSFLDYYHANTKPLKESMMI